MALLAKLAWRAFNEPSSLWAATLVKKYTKKGVLDNNSIAQPHHSLLWKDLLTGWEACKLGIEWVLGDGRSISMWSDKWLPK